MDLNRIFTTIGVDRDYSQLGYEELQPDLQGWGSNSPYFEMAFIAGKPKVVVEVGTWKGASVCHMAKLSDKLGLGTQFICIDTWLGSNDTLWLNAEYRKWLMLRGGYPSMFRQFIKNIHDQGCEKKIFPLPMTSSCGYYLLKRLNIVADLIYIDAGHEDPEVYADVSMYYNLLRPGGIMLGDDYTQGWSGVVSAVNRFAAEQKLMLTCSGGKFMFYKPA